MLARCTALTDLLILELGRILHLEPLCDRTVLEGAGEAMAVLHLDLPQGLRLRDYLNKACEQQAQTRALSSADKRRAGNTAWKQSCQIGL